MSQSPFKKILQKKKHEKKLRSDVRTDDIEEEENGVSDVDDVCLEPAEISVQRRHHVIGSDQLLQRDNRWPINYLIT